MDVQSNWRFSYIILTTLMRTRNQTNSYEIKETALAQLKLTASGVLFFCLNKFPNHWDNSLFKDKWKKYIIFYENISDSTFFGCRNRNLGGSFGDRMRIVHPYWNQQTFRFHKTSRLKSLDCSSVVIVMNQNVLRLYRPLSQSVGNLIGHFVI